MPARLPQNIHKLAPRPYGKLRVKNEVLGGSKIKLNGICVTEMQQVFICFKNYTFNEEACASEIAKFKECFNSHRTRYENHKNSSKNAEALDLTNLLRKYPERLKDKY